MTTLPQQDVDLEAQTQPHVSGFLSSSGITVTSPGVASDMPNPSGHEASSSIPATPSGRRLLSEAFMKSFFTGQKSDMADDEGTGATPENGEDVLADAATMRDQTTTQWNGQPSDWASWPNGRPGPFISEDALKLYSSLIGDVTTEAEMRMKTDELVFHVAEFTQSGKEIFRSHVTELQFAQRLDTTDPECRFRFLFLSSKRGFAAIGSSFSVRALSYCNAPAAALQSWTSNFTNLFHSFHDHQDGDSRYHAWANCRHHWTTTHFGLELLQNPWLQEQMGIHGCLTIYPKFYLCYDFKTHMMTVLTSDLNLAHRSMIKICGDQGEGGVRARADPFSFVGLWYEAIFESYRQTVEKWELDSHEWAAPRAFMNDIAYEKRVKRTENDCRVISSAVQSVRILREAFAQLDSEHRAFGDAIDTEKLAWNSTKRSIDRLSLKAVEVVQALDVLFSDYERYLTVLLGFTNGRMIEEMKNIAKENAMQTQATILLAKEARRDSEIMKVIAFVTMIYLPATLMCTVFSMGFFSFDFDHAKGQIQISDQVWIWFASTLPLTVLTLGLSYFWIWLKDPNRQNHVSSANDILTPRRSEKPISKKSSASSIAAKDIKNLAELLALREQVRKGKSEGHKSLPSIPPRSPPKSQYEGE